MSHVRNPPKFVHNLTGNSTYRFSNTSKLYRMMENLGDRRRTAKKKFANNLGNRRTANFQRVRQHLRNKRAHQNFVDFTLTPAHTNAPSRRPGNGACTIRPRPPSGGYTLRKQRKQRTQRK